MKSLRRAEAGVHGDHLPIESYGIEPARTTGADPDHPGMLRDGMTCSRLRVERAAVIPSLAIVPRATNRR